MADFPALPLWTDAYLADLHPRLTLEQHGCMILMMQFAWRSPDCRLPDDDAKLARMLGVSRAKWAKLRPVMAEIWNVKANFWSQKRLTKEHDYVVGRRERYSERGRKGGEAKALKHKESGLHQEDESTGQEPQSGSLEDAKGVGTHNPQPITHKKKKEPPGPKRDLPPHDADPEFDLVEDRPVGLDRSEVGKAVTLWNVMAGEVGLPLVQKITKVRRAKTKARLKDCGGLEGWGAALTKLRHAPFLNGQNDRHWRADFDFMIQEKSFTKLMEDGYADHEPAGGGAGPGGLSPSQAAVAGILGEPPAPGG